MSARWITADVFEGLATLEDGSVDLVITSPPFLALRSYLPTDHPDKDKEIGSEPTPAAFIDVMLAVTAELRRVLAPHGSICVELGDTYSGSGESGWERDKGEYRRENRSAASANGQLEQRRDLSNGWPLSKSKTLIPELYRLALAYGINPLTGQESPAGRWRVRNVVTWCRPNPPVGALGDKWRPATSDIVIACTSDKRYWDDIATRRPLQESTQERMKNGGYVASLDRGGRGRDNAKAPVAFAFQEKGHGAPLLDYWELPPGGYPGSHYAVYPPALVEPLIKAMAPPKVCETCGEPSRRIVERPTEWRDRHPAFADLLRSARQSQGMSQRDVDVLFGYNGMCSHWERAIRGDQSQPAYPNEEQWETLKERLSIDSAEFDDLISGFRRFTEQATTDEYRNLLTITRRDGFYIKGEEAGGRASARGPSTTRQVETLGWSDCGHNDWRPALVLDPFAGSGTTLSVATGHGHDALGIDLDERNRDLALDRIGPFLFEEMTL